MKDPNDDKKRTNIKGLGRQLAFVTSSGFMMVFCILGGYFIGNQFSETGRIIGVAIGSILGAFLFIADLYAFIRMDEKSKERKEKEKNQNTDDEKIIK